MASLNGPSSPSRVVRRLADVIGFEIRVEPQDLVCVVPAGRTLLNFASCIGLQGVSCYPDWDSKFEPTATMSTSSTAGQLFADDIEQLELMVRPWDVRMRQVSPGKLSARLQYLQANGILLYRMY